MPKLNGGDGNDDLTASGYSYGYRDDFYISNYISGNSTLNGGAGDDRLSVAISTGDNLLSGGDGNDSLSAYSYYDLNNIYETSGNNTKRNEAIRLRLGLLLYETQARTRPSQ